MYVDESCNEKNTPIRSLNYIKKTYQNELNLVANYMIENGLQISTGKTHMMLFNNGSNPINLPAFKINDGILEYKKVVKFLGVFLTTKLTWNNHIEYILNKARKTLNLLKIISKQLWGQSTFTLLHLSTSLIRSKLTYAQEAFFNAPKYLLKKLQSIDCRAYKLALGLPVHASSLKTYSASGVLPLEDYRRVACSKFILRSMTVKNDLDSELNLMSDQDFPKRARSISSQTTLGTYTSSVFSKSGFTKKINIATRCNVSPIPEWELKRAQFDVNYTDLTKGSNINLLSSYAKIHLDENYSNHLKVFTDGSVINNNAGAAYIIPDLKIKKSFHLGENKSVFTAELVAVLMALNFFINFPKVIFQLLFCVDSKSVICALRSIQTQVRSELVTEIRHLIHLLSLQGSYITFCWIPSHCGFYHNEKVDCLAKKGAMGLMNVANLEFPLSLEESYHMVQKAQQTLFQTEIKTISCFDLHKEVRKFDSLVRSLADNVYWAKQVVSLAFRWKLNCFKTKYVKSAFCLCGDHITVDHILTCHILKGHIPILTLHSTSAIFGDPLLMYDFFRSLLHSPVGPLL